MDTKAFYFRVGLFVFSLFLGIILFLLWLGGRSLDDDRVPYDIYFQGSISGLIVGSPVKYKGLTVGNVDEMTIPKNNVEVVKIRIMVDPDIQIKEDSMAQLQMQGITGGSFIQITGGSNEAKNIQTSKRNVGVIPTSPSSIESLTQNLPVLMNNLTELTSRMNSV